MGKRKQSKVSWSKRGQPLAEADQDAKRRANQDRRTGAVGGLSDSQLFAVDASAARAKPVGLGHRRKPRAERRLHVDEVIATNPHIPVVVKPPVASVKSTSVSRRAHTLLVRDKLGKIRKAASRTLVHSAARAAALAAAAPAPAPIDSLDIWGAAGSTKHARPASRRAPEPSRIGAAVPLPAEGASWNPDFDAHQALLAEATAHVVHEAKKEQVHRLAWLFPPAPWVEDEEDLTNMLDEKHYYEDEVSDDDDDDGERADASGWHVDHPPISSTQRNKQARAKVREQERAALAAQRKREKQLSRVGALEAEIKREERARRAAGGGGCDRGP